MKELEGLYRDAIDLEDSSRRVKSGISTCGIQFFHSPNLITYSEVSPKFMCLMILTIDKY